MFSGEGKGVTAVEKLKAKVEVLKCELYAIYLCWKDPEVPRLAKVLILLVLAYAVSPVDLIPDFIPVLGYLDDLILLPLGIMLVIRLVPKEIYAKHRAAARVEKFRDPAFVRIGLLMTLGVWIFIALLVLKLAGVF